MMHAVRPTLALLILTLLAACGPGRLFDPSRPTPPAIQEKFGP
jgi:hypothetical protein